MAVRCNQDIFESFFSLIRGFGKFYDYPLPVTVSQQIKIFMLSRSSNTIITNGNCCEEQTSTLSSEIVQNLTSENSDEMEEKAIISIIRNEVLEEKKYYKAMILKTMMQKIIMKIIFIPCPQKIQTL